jgi:PD-(D/E)XK nuclease superfamily protein
MTENWLEEKDDRSVKRDIPFISFSQINRYLTCPESYRLYYIERLRLKVPKANLVFGSLIHLSLSHLFNAKAEPVKFFSEVWGGLKQIDLTYGKKDSWERLRVCGVGLLTKFVAEELPRIRLVKAVEKPFKLEISSLDLPIVGVIDLVAEIEDRNKVVDFKTADKSYGPVDIVLSDQLTTYQLTEPEVPDLALCVLVKTTEPKIEWYPTRRNSTRLTEFLNKAGYVAREIKAGEFYKRTGVHCSWCDFLPMCLGDKNKATETLVKVE